MTPVILGFDTSNYKTSIAVFSPSDQTYRLEGRLLNVPAGALGLRQNEALFQHVRHLPLLAERLLDGAPVLAVGYSDRPRAVEGSYMPCFLAGESAARTVAAAFGVPCRASSHQEGHLASAAFSCGRFDLMGQEFLAWHLSGGTTEFLHVYPDLRTEIIGGTEDISAGQLIDRTGVLLGLRFPAGPDVERLALSSDNGDFFSVKIKQGFFSLSGMENQVKSRIGVGLPAPEICRFSLLTIADVILRCTRTMQEELNLPVLVSGGVSVNRLLQKAMACETNVYFAQNGLGGDNALGTALLTSRKENLL